ncbi:metallophosphoesterase [Candidatus Omnitrophus magneticus]|uniref:Metallophosphoesterase n=1 Tax=Candidatus Omnitrophus magneticus TaxID=1609969 RepID=A0A0F0CVB9_9BACT|nr:metallophosphoesterase [Candidatus Omnitrophus magneticus]
MKLIKIILFVAIAAIIYSFLPMIKFMTIPAASKEDNNQSNIEKLKNNQGAYFSFIIFGDNHAGFSINDASTIKEIWHMNREDRFRKIPIDFVLSVGDVSLNGARKHFEAFKKLQKLIKYPVIAAIGNHDSSLLFNEYCGIKEFTFVNRNSFFIVLDNEAGELSEKQFEWFESKLKEGTRYAHIFVILHKPPFDPYQQEWYNMDNSPWAYEFRKLCAEYRVDMVFTGHKHMFKSQKFDGVEYIVTGGGGMITEMPEKDGGYLHYVRVMVNHDYVTYEVRKVTPPLWTQFIYYFWKEAVYWARNFYGSGYIFNVNRKHEPARVKQLNDDEYWVINKNPAVE